MASFRDPDLTVLGDQYIGGAGAEIEALLNEYIFGNTGAVVYTAPPPPSSPASPPTATAPQSITVADAGSVGIPTPLPSIPQATQPQAQIPSAVSIPTPTLPPSIVAPLQIQDRELAKGDTKRVLIYRPLEEPLDEVLDAAIIAIIEAVGVKRIPGGAGIARRIWNKIRTLPRRGTPRRDSPRRTAPKKSPWRIPRRSPTRLPNKAPGKGVPDPWAQPQRPFDPLRPIPGKSATPKRPTVPEIVAPGRLPLPPPTAPTTPAPPSRAPQVPKKAPSAPALPRPSAPPSSPPLNRRLWRLALLGLPIIAAAAAPSRAGRTSPMSLSDIAGGQTPSPGGLTQAQQGLLQSLGPMRAPVEDVCDACARSKRSQRKKRRKCSTRYNVAWTSGPNRGKLAGTRCFRFDARRAAKNVGRKLGENVKELF